MERAVSDPARTVAGIDLGTQSMKVTVYDAEAKASVATVSCPLDIISGEDGTREQKAEWYRDALKACFDKLSPEIKAGIQALGVSGQQHGFVPLDKGGKALYNVKLWNDTSTAEECGIITDALGGTDGAVREVQNYILPGYTAPKILWLKRHRKELFDKLHYVMLPHNYINYLLTGEYTAEPGDASGTALYDSVKGAWSPAACGVIDSRLLSLMPRLIKSEEPAGRVTKESAEWLGIRQGAYVSSGGGDNMMSAIGTGVTEEGLLTVSMGTSGTLYGFSATSVSNPAEGISGFCSSSGGYLPLLCTMNCTVASEEIRALFGMDLKALGEAAGAAPCGAEGVYVIPFFNGERTPNLPHARASITGLTLANTSRDNIARAALESAIYALRGGLDSFRKRGFNPKSLRLTGGGAKSAVWRQIVADIMGLTVEVPSSSEAAAEGAALQALWCLETAEGGSRSMADITREHVTLDGSLKTEPVAENVKVYDEAFKGYRTLVETLSPLYT